MENLQYNIHKILWSKYKFIINILVLSLIYLSFYSQQLTYCMTEGNIPAVAEAKSTEANIQQIIHREVYSYLEPAKEIERLTNALAEQKARAQNAYDAAGRFQNDYRNEVASKQEILQKYEELIQTNTKIQSESTLEHRREIKALKREITGLQEQIRMDKKTNLDTYENHIRQLTTKINRQKLEIRELRAANSTFNLFSK